jgi:hypothetical protein
VAWVRDRPKEYLWSAQRAIIESVRDNRYTAVPSAHDLGKSFVGSRVIGWWNDVHVSGDSFVVSTAPTAAQVSAILWREVAKVHRLAKLRGRINRAGYPQWYEGAELVGYGRKPADYEESAFQGIHALHVLIVIDEAGGVARHLFDAVDALATNEYARVLAIGNPDDPGSHFASICKPGSGWNVIQLDGLRSPNMSAAQIVGDDPNHPTYPLVAALMAAEGIEYNDEPVPPNLRPYLLSPLWVEERIKRWCGIPDSALDDYDTDELGEMIRRRADGSPLFQAKVRGIFPTSTATGVVPLGWVQQAVNRWKDWDFAGRPLDATRATNRIVGVDVAYGGLDETCIALRFGDIITELNRYRHADTVDTADVAAPHIQEPQALAVVDVIGIGAGVYDTLKRYRRDGIRDAETGQLLVAPGVVGRSIPFNAAATSHRSDKIGEFKFRNDRAAAWWKFREAIDPSRGSRMMLPDDERLIEELTAVKYSHLAGGIIQVESKDEIRKRLGRSTDSADAVIQAFWPDGMRMDTLAPIDVDLVEQGKLTRAERSGLNKRGVIDYTSSSEYERFDASQFDVSDHGYLG